MSPSGLDLSEPKPFKMPGFSVIGHRGNGMNVLQSSDRRTRGFKENSILSFNSAAKFPIDFIEFDVQFLRIDMNKKIGEREIMATESESTSFVWLFLFFVGDKR